MSPTRLISAVSAAALLGALAVPAYAQAPQPTTEAAAKAQTGKSTTDAPANTAVQGTAKAVKQAAPAATGQPATAQAPAAPAAAPAAAAGKAVTVQGDLVDTLKLSGQFNTFVQGIDATNLTGLLKQNKNLTVFAPTDAAFAAMPADEFAKLKADKVAMQKFVLRHVVNAPIDSTKIKGAKGPVPSGSGDQILLDGSDEAALKVDGATILQADLRTGSGLLHVVDKVLPEGLGGDTSTPAATGEAAATTSTTTAQSSAAQGTKAKQ